MPKNPDTALVLERRFTWTRFQVLVMLSVHGELYGLQFGMSSAVYPVLYDLQKAGLIASRREIGNQSLLGRRLRNYYLITDEGQKEVKDMLSSCGLELVIYE